MSQGDTPITIVGNLVADPELRYTQSGVAVTNGRVASTPRVYNKDTNQWEDGEALFLQFTSWRAEAENIANSLAKGQRVIVVGVLRQRSYEDRDGTKRSSYEIQDAEVAASLKFATVQTTRTPRGGSSGGGYGGSPASSGPNGGGGYNGGGGGFPAGDEDPWGGNQGGGWS